jgi:adenine-specific DNA-methyltransferase
MTKQAKPVAPNAVRPRRKAEPVLASSTDLVSERRAFLRQHFPEAITEDGRVDFDRLRQSLGELIDTDRERYTFSWAGKRDAVRMLQLPSRATLLPAQDLSVDSEHTDNAFIEGDNLEVLKLLHRPYFGRIRMIYVDPPYNTGDDKIYVDDYADPLDAYLKYTGQKDAEGNLLTTNPETSGRFHSAWLSMMYPRLFLARQLLRDDGVLFISCNDIEQAHIRLILNEIFGEENFVATFIWNNEGNIDNQSKVKSNHEFIHMYARSIDRLERPAVIDPNIEEGSKLFRDEIENSITKNGPANPASKVTLPAGFPAAFESGTIKKRTSKYPYIHSDAHVKASVLTKTVDVESGWSSRNLLQLFIDNGFQPILDGQGKQTRFALTKTGAIYGYKSRPEDQGHVLTVIRNVGTTKQTSSMLEKWGLKFDWPKPVRLIEYLCQIATKGDDLILDFFAGSGTTAQAVVAANKRDGGRRRYIMVQLPEELREAQTAKSGHVLNTIADLGAERIRCADAELSADGGSAGFRHFALAASFIKPWKGVEEHDATSYLDQMTWFADSLVDDWTREGVLWEVAIKEGYSLNSRIERVPEAVTNEVWRVTDADRSQSFLICLDDELSVAGANELDLTTDVLFICRDTALNDELAANLALQCRLKTI